MALTPSTASRTWLEEEVLRRDFLGVQPGLERIASVLEALGSPHHRLGKVLLVAGTNGKGSAAAFAESLLRHAGFAVTLNTSPHLADICERLRVNGLDVEPRALDAAARRVAAAERSADRLLTGFELVTAACFEAAATARPDYSVVEVGMGGLLDATNVVTPTVSVITPVGLDHTDRLGPDLVSIARQKFGITRPNVPCVCARQADAVGAFLCGQARSASVPLLIEGRDFVAGGTPEAFRFDGLGSSLSGLRLGLQGRYQVSNAGVALASCLAAVQDAPRIEKAAAPALTGVRWPGRFDMRDVDGSAVLFDGAHNGHGAEALAAAFVAAFPERPAVLIALKKGKDAAAVLAPIARIASRLLFTTLPGTPGYDPEELAQLAPSGLPCEVVRDPDAALLLLAKAGGRPGMALCCGSLYLVGYYLARLGRGAD